MSAVNPSLRLQTALLRPSRLRVVRPTLAPRTPASAFTSPRLTAQSKSYSTAPNQQQVLQSFGTPFAQFIHTISRIARIITYSALGVATIGVVSFEAAHQYVEHVAMPAAAAAASSSDDLYGWSELALEESWSGSPERRGTDPRLGIKGRHAVRSAWMCVNWGGGISPSVMFGGGSGGNSGLGRTAITSMSSSKALHVDDGMILAMQYLNLAVKIAASKGIKLPDTDAIRAGLITDDAAKRELGNVDPLALALEARLAAVKERQGSRGALESAISSYEKLYDIASWTESTSRDHASRRVRLATKLGDLHSALDRKGDAEEWLARAVGVAATAGAGMLEADVSKVETVAESNKSRLGGWFSTSKSSVPTQVAEPVSAPAAVVAAPPALTRSLITALVSKSALHAHTPTPASLQQALQTQMSALQLSSAELNRLHPFSSTQPGAELHKLWILHHQSILDLHVAETVFALTRGSSSGKTASKLIPSWFKGSKDGGKAIEWVEQADARAREVILALEGRKGKEDEVLLDERWSKDKVVALGAGRVLRDAKRVRAAAGRSKSTLEGL
ncbi:hypothetical protein PHSY_002818 [Pseudozyma hubeiensis SY62]|uniref:Uncharacterized protein n=1 Tax=Pseudozyma hubeiensis (strain SY62) TaxID=1305764 RepID=R9P1R1_PSEHS|nr:hypothetical protein PHSY_002818 [Pseudozyma hubeiensis SY62]GAC95243.1 hypothetical protein PHSY_002818 [Pseudozyma hubeiensis SY62]